MQHKVLVEGISEEVEEVLKSFRMDTIYLQFDIITQKVLKEKIIQHIYLGVLNASIRAPESRSTPAP